MQSEFVTQISALRHFDWVDFANQISNRCVRRGKFFTVPIVTMHPDNWCGVTLLGDHVTSVTRNWCIGVVVDFTSSNYRHPLVEQTSKRTNDSCFALAALTKKNNVVAGEQCILQLWHDRIVVAKNAGGELLVGANALHGIAANFFFD